MRRYVLYFRLAMVALAAALRRLFRGGPKRPGWSFRFELLVAVLREAIARAGVRGVGGSSQRRLAKDALEGQHKRPAQPVDQPDKPARLVGAE